MTSRATGGGGDAQMYELPSTYPVRWWWWWYLVPSWPPAATQRLYHPTTVFVSPLPPLLLFQSSAFCDLYFHPSCYCNLTLFIIVVAVHHSVSLSHSLPRLELLLKSSTFPPSRLFGWPYHHGLCSYSLFSYPTSRTQSRPGRPRRLGVLQ